VLLENKGNEGGCSTSFHFVPRARMIWDYAAGCQAKNFRSPARKYKRWKKKQSDPGRKARSTAFLAFSEY